MSLKIIISPDDFKLSFYLGRINPTQAHEYLHVNRTTAARWFTGDSRIPWTAYRCAQVDLAGAMPVAAGPDWTGWRFTAGKLISPENQAFNMGEIRNIPWQYTITAGLRRELRLAKSQNSRLEEQLSAIDAKPAYAETA